MKFSKNKCLFTKNTQNRDRHFSTHNGKTSAWEEYESWGWKECGSLMISLGQGIDQALTSLLWYTSVLWSRSVF